MSLFALPPIPDVPVRGEAEAYPVRRIFCVGRNYAAHAAEMGNEVDREAPFYFTKSPAHLVLSGAELPFPPGTEDYHHEMEFVVALGAPLFRGTPDQAARSIYGYACGLDMTRRDLQGAAKDKRRPWSLGKDVEGSALIGEITRATDFGAVADQAITLKVNGALRQDANLSELIHKVPDVIAHLSGYYHLGPGDLIYTGTPAGVGAVQAGDVLEGAIAGLTPIRLTLGAPD
ncbi:fumarylacetoacetate hydrolase family protein [Pseudooceanicola sp.]|uniref:fumarylacetoacetate hydrolase family protein n=1 Tax=Pseudooceanicola sp. TaxID=1914328 RepID=UPI002618A2B7|nr:fumarylacetoacetate hydrolase family protein [Pseudooceanicola sp.]MDF1855393.1 fumarylacetoacetate hydrolase family protein [Pseudooceanicola sp.]